ncbi:NADH-quinone oxidoreductase subunit NuoE [Candidatus Contubernalis alkaliaceticus]|uniref:NADH-quinone oxidoreductase subunit NuoE n=1 Tax=Candidatus Contubernalis alkaliaceticus TaxID=338645 RepID=UPI001F4C11B0|nr:NADH-quinone oxidoreductase subunit NuoE [Candidatus Contubernalis alkalaceticus]UNC91802.1 NADH-quinone oxidoreductase subunit NuoE [Candidatus Contubernalis alkalaceticus]
MFDLELSAEEKEVIISQVSEILGQHKHNCENLVPMLQEVQQKLGYVPELAMEIIADALGVPAVSVYGIVTFYNQLRLNPPGDHEIKVCMGTACHMIGGQIILDSFERRLEIVEGETTLDRKFSLERVACVGCCAIAPVVVVDDYVDGKVTPTRVDGILLAFENTGKDKKQEQQEEKGEGQE